jgi:hypothetical protein
LKKTKNDLKILRRLHKDELEDIALLVTNLWKIIMAATTVLDGEDDIAGRFYEFN